MERRIHFVGGGNGHEIRFSYSSQNDNISRLKSTFIKFRKQQFVDVFQNGLLKNFSIFTGKQLSWSYFIGKLHIRRLAILLKIDFNTGVLL